MVLIDVQFCMGQVKATDVTISKAANLATIVQRPQASDLVWSIYTAHKAGKKDWGSHDTQMDVLRAVCAAPPAGSEGEVRITSLLESCMAEESGGAGQGAHALRRAVRAGMAAASTSPTTVLFLKHFLVEHGQELDQEMLAMVSRATAKCRRRRLLGALFLPLNKARQGVGAAVRRPREMCARAVEALLGRGGGSLGSDTAALDRKAKERWYNGERNHGDVPLLSLAPVAATLVCVVGVIAGAGGGVQWEDPAKVPTLALGRLDHMFGKGVGAVLSTLSGFKEQEQKPTQQDPEWFEKVQWSEGGRRRGDNDDAQDD